MTKFNKPYSNMANEIVAEVSQNVVKKTREVSTTLAKELAVHTDAINKIELRLKSIECYDDKHLFAYLKEFERKQEHITNHISIQDEISESMQKTIDKLKKDIDNLEDDIERMEADNLMRKAAEGTGDTLTLEGSVITAPVSTASIEYHTHHHHPPASLLTMLKDKFLSPSTAVAVADQLSPEGKKKGMPWGIIVRVFAWAFIVCLIASYSYYYK